MFQPSNISAFVIWVHKHSAKTPDALTIHIAYTWVIMLILSFLFLNLAFGIYSAFLFSLCWFSNEYQIQISMHLFVVYNSYMSFKKWLIFTSNKLSKFKSCYKHGPRNSSGPHRDQTKPIGSGPKWIAQEDPLQSYN